MDKIYSIQYTLKPTRGHKIEYFGLEASLATRIAIMLKQDEADYFVVEVVHNPSEWMIEQIEIIELPEGVQLRGVPEDQLYKYGIQPWKEH